MQPLYFLKRTTTDDPHFLYLINQLDNELWNELKEDQATYDQFNKVPHIETAMVLYVKDEAIACGCFKVVGEKEIEIKRMFVKKSFRGKGYSKIILTGLEDWAKSLGYQVAVLETSVHFATAQNLYGSTGYVVIPNYPPYNDLPESVCMRKHLVPAPASNH